MKIKEFESWLRQKGTALDSTASTSGEELVPEELSDKVAAQLAEVSPIRSLADVDTVESQLSHAIVTDGAAATTWLAESGDHSSNTNTPDMYKRTAVIGELFARPRAYEQVLEDGVFDVSAWLVSELVKAFAKAEGAEFLNGSGTNRPAGILNGLTAGADAAASQADAEYQVVDSGVSGAFGGTDAAIITFLESVVDAVPTQYLPGSVWLMNRATLKSVSNVQLAGGDNLIDPREPYGSKTLLGFRVVVDDAMDDLASGAAFPALFGNFAAAYRVCDRTGLEVSRDPFANYGSVDFVTRKRIGSMVLDATALKAVSVSA